MANEDWVCQLGDRVCRSDMLDRYSSGWTCQANRCQNPSSWWLLHGSWQMLALIGIHGFVRVESRWIF
jgi:hypothetical protein